MPTFVVHVIGKPAESKFVDRETIRVGRDNRSDLVLKNISVSRKHALIKKLEDGTWVLQPVSKGNPVMLDGQAVEETAPLKEGAEIQLGTFYIIFSEKREVQGTYLNKKGFKVDAKCKSCGFMQKISALIDSPACQKCGGRQVEQTGGWQGRGEGTPGATPAGDGGATTALDTRQLMQQRAKMRTASRSMIVPSGGRPADAKTLDQARTCTFGKPGQSTIGVEGFLLGTPAEINWVDTGYVITKTSIWPGLKVNGESVKEAALKNGDRINVGRNDFRFVVK